MTIQSVLEKTIKFLKEKKFPTARLDSELIISNSLGMSRMDLYLKYEQPLNEVDLIKCREALRRRATGEPVAYILGQKDFYKRSFVVDKNVLIPRPETELIVEMAVKWAKDKSILNPKILDLGTGSGCLGVSLACEISGATVYCMDISNSAIELAKQNASAHDCSDRTHFILANAEDCNHESNYDIIVANPPYIAKNDPDVDAFVQKFEPEMALFSEKNGMHSIESWLLNIVNNINNPGLVLFEIGYLQGQQASQVFKTTNAFDSISIEKDYSGRDRFIKGTRG